MPRLPPVPISPQMRWRARFWPGVMESVATFFQSHSSSSATSWARPVNVPCPISERAMRMTQVSSDLTTTHALISVAVSAAAPLASAALRTKRDGTPSASPPPATAAPTMKRRRESALLFFMSGPPLTGRRVHCRADALIRSAATDVVHRVVDVLVRRIRLALEQSGGRHDLPRLAVTALRDVQRGPRLLHWVGPTGRESFDGHDLVRGLQAAHGDSARA